MLPTHGHNILLPNLHRHDGVNVVVCGALRATWILYRGCIAWAVCALRSGSLVTVRL